MAFNSGKAKTSPKKILPFETTSPVGMEDRPEEEKAKTRAKIFAEIPDPTGEELKDSKILNLAATIGPNCFVSAEEKVSKNGTNKQQ